MNSQRRNFIKLLASFALGLGGAALLPLSGAIAAPILTIEPITWNIIGLDSNNVNVGPNVFMIGARVCNTGDTPATNVTASFIKDGATNSLINLQGSSTLSLASLSTGTRTAAQTRPPTYSGAIPANCTDFYYNIVVTRNSAAYNTTQGYHIQATATGLGTISTPTPRELYVEKLVSQNRNAVNSITGPSTVVVGQTYNYTVTGKTATGGYEQLVFSPDFPNILFQVLGVSANYAQPGGGTNNSTYADACGWTNNPSSIYYHNNISCTEPSIPDGYTGSKAGGNPISVTYTVKVLSAGSANITNVIYDYSGSSYHYNSDFGSGINAISITAQNPVSSPDLEISKTHSGNFSVNTSGQYTLTVKNVGLSATTGTITVTDVLPTALSNLAADVTATGGGWSCSFNATNRTVTCTTSAILAAGQSSNPITLTVKPTTATAFTNIATVSTTGDTNSGNNSANDPTTVNTPVDLSITKTDNLTNISPGGLITYIITITNNSADLVSNAIVTDSVPAIITGAGGIGSVSWTCTTSGGAGSGSNSCGSTTGTGNEIDTTVTLRRNAVATYTITGTLSNTPTTTSLSNTAIVSPPAGSGDTVPADNTATDSTTILIPDLTLVKTHTGTFTQGQTGATYTLTATNSGTAATTSNVTVTDTLPTNIVPTAATGTGWDCTITGQAVSCTRTTFTTLGTATSYPPITITVSIANSIVSPQTNTANITGGGETNTTNNSAIDNTTITSSTSSPISCDGNFYQIRVTTGSQLFLINRNVSPYTQTQIGNITPSITLNALGYNKLDGFMYAIGTNTNHLYRIDQNGAVFLGLVSDLPALDYNTATFDSAGNFYIKQGTLNNTIYKINISTRTATPITLNQNINLGDMAFHPTDGAIYGLRDATLYKITLSGATGTVTTIGSTNISGSPSVGSVFFDASGTLYGYENGGTFYLINTTNGNATQVSTAPSSSVSDGASCVFTAPERVISTVKSVGTVAKVNPTTFNVPYSIVVTNTGTNTAPNTQITENLNLTFNTGTPTFTFPTAPTVTNGSCTANTAFNGTTDTKLLTGSNTLAIGGTCTIAFTVQVVYPNVASVPSAVQNNTVYASSVLNSPNTGYTFVGGSPVPPPALLSSAQSTVGLTYPATTNSPNVLLVKRITAVNGVNVTGFQDGVNIPGDPNNVGTKAAEDNDPLWPATPATSLRGAIHSSTITPAVTLKPGDEVEYTIYYLNKGTSNASNVSICDFVPANQTYVGIGFNASSLLADTGGLIGSNYGIVILGSNGATLVKATNAGDGDRGQYYSSGFPASCTGTNSNRGAVVVNLGTVRNATGSGTPADSYGFIRFKAKID